MVCQTITIIIGDLPPSTIIFYHHDARSSKQIKYHICVSLHLRGTTTTPLSRHTLSPSPNGSSNYRHYDRRSATFKDYFWSPRCHI
ncbi:unnamed protein product [Trifolium pratense]|uniref:Uncharacterized protein n=1 Tax=Trifolium pratense TaxID=57577 RepID=A0ACB0LVY8_TRIPR|nr:unnamed protein product [Trifolium pratense]